MIENQYIKEIKAINYKSNITSYHKAYNHYKKKNVNEQINIALFSSYTIDQLEPFVAIELLKNGILPSFYIPGFNQYENVIYNSKSDFYSISRDIVFISLRLEDILPELFYISTNSDYEKLIEPFIKKIDRLVASIKENTKTNIFFCNFLLPRFLIQNINDFQIDHGQSGVIYSINQKIKELTKNYEGVYIIDLMNIASEFGLNKVYDDKMYYYASIPYSADFMKYLGYKIGQYCNALINPRKKCLVLDLDNTLWGGIIGEDNLDGILLGTDYPGNVYVEIQKIIKEISKTGVLLAINSKNNFDDVKAVFDKHPNSVLKLDDFSAYRINWNEKHINMVEIATELNIGTDSFVFIDDNPVEIGAINHLLPEVATIQFDKNNSINNLKLIRDMDFFFSLKITSEDMAKTDHYKQQATRKQLFKSFENVDEFYESLNIRISVNECNSFSISRVSQLTMKTNQFNLTTKRYTESDIKKFQNDNKTHIYYLSLKDKIGDYGIVGVFIGFERNNEINIDTFLMSCRVIGRQIEKAFIGYLMDVFHSLGFRSINGLYIETKKNSIVKEFYKDIGFIKNEDNWSKDLSIGIKIPAWLTIENE